MVRPFIFDDFVVKFLVVVRTGTHVEYQKILTVVLLEVSSNIVDGVPEGFFEEIRSRVSHCDDTVSYVGQI